MLRILSTFALTAALAVPIAAQANTVSFSDLGTTGCGPTLVGSFYTIGQGNGLFIELTVTTEQVAPPVMLFISASPIVPGLPIDGIFGQNYGCVLNLNPVFSQAHQALGNTYVWNRSLGGWWGTAYVQFAEVFLDGGLEVKTTNLLEVTRPFM